MAASDFWTTVAPSLVAAASGLVGAFIGGAISRYNDQRKQRLDFAAQQLRDLYAPLVAIRKRILTLSELRVKATYAAEPEHYRDWGKEPTTVEGVFKQQAEHRGRMDDLEKVIAFYNEQFKAELLPLYEEMEQVFPQKMHLAGPETQIHYPALVEFIELWKRHFAGDIPKRVIVNIGVTESKLQPFYADLTSQFDRLQNMLRQANPDVKA